MTSTRAHQQGPHSLVIAAAIACVLAACGKADLTGNVFLTFGAGDVKPAAGLEVVLVKGNVKTLLIQSRERSLTQARSEAERSLLDQLQSELHQAEELFDSAKRDFALLSPTAEVQDVYCSAPCEAAVKTARALVEPLAAEVHRKIDDIKSKTAELQQKRRSLESVIGEKVAREAKRLADQYYQQSITATHFIKSDSGYDSIASRMGSQHLTPHDELCWRVTNRGNVSLVSLDHRITFNDIELPPKVGRAIWSGLSGLESSTLTFQRNNRYSEFVSGLGPGETAESCMYPLFSLSGDEQRWAEAHGLSKGSHSRSGTWVIRWSNPVLGGPRRTVTDGYIYKGFPRTNPMDAFDKELAVYRNGLSEQHELTILAAKLKESDAAESDITTKYNSSDGALALKRAEESQSVCARLITAHDTVKEVRNGIEQLRKGSVTDKRLLDRLETAMQVTLADPERARQLLNEAKKAIALSTVSTTHTAIDGLFHFGPVPGGEYTLIAEYKTNLGSSANWIVPVQVTGTTKQDLANYNMHEGALEAALETLLSPQNGQPKRDAEERS